MDHGWRCSVWVGAFCALASSALAFDGAGPVATEGAEAPPAVDDSRKSPSPLPPGEERTTRNSVYFEAGGAGFLYSVNYERRFGNVAGRIGFGGIPDIAGTHSYDHASTRSSDGTSTSTSIVFVPVTIDYLGVGSKVHMLEIGGGVTVVEILGERSGSSGWLAYSKGSGLGLFGNVLVGYRWQSPRGGVVLRAGVDGLISTGKIPVFPWPYLAAGSSF